MYKNALTIPRTLRLSSTATRALIISQGFALVYWLIALWLRTLNLLPIWHDQWITFTRAYPLANPYGFSDSKFIYPPWAALVFSAFSHLPFTAATLIQLCLYFAILTAIIFKFGGGLRAALITFTSFIMFDAVLELNIEWLTYLALLVPTAYSGPLLAIKPQSALGYWLGQRWADLVQALIVLLVTVLVSFALWGPWPIAMLDAIRRHTLASAYYSINIAPMAFLSAPVALAIGIALAVWAIRRHDSALGILAGLFFVPYITLYSLPLPFAILAIRWPRWALLVSLVMWVAYGGLLARFLLRV